MALLAVRRGRPILIKHKPGASLKEAIPVHAHFLEGSYDPSGRTFDVIILTEGLGNKRDKHFYLRETIKQAVADGVFEGEQCYADHPSKFDDQNRPERSVRDLVGYFTDSKYVEVDDKKNPGKLLAAYGAKLKINQGCDWVVGLIQEAIDFSKRFPDKTLAGISINADGDTVPRSRGNLGEVKDVTKITDAFSADIVTKPARQGGFLKLVEGAAGAHKFTYSKGAGMVTQAQVLDAAKKLKEAANGESVDPAELTNIAALLEEAKVVESDDTKKEDVKEGDKKEADKKKKDTQDSKDAMNDGNNTGDSKDDGEEMSEDDKKKKEAAAAKARGNLLESESDSDLKKKYPSIYAAALREAQRTGGTSEDEEKNRILKENAELRAGRDLRESTDLAKKVLRESNLPEAAYRRTLTNMIGHSEAEMRSIVSDEEQFLESIGVTKDGAQKRVAGNGTRVNLLESDKNKNTSRLLEGVAPVED